MTEYRKYVVGLLVSVSTLIALYVNLFQGIDTVYTHFFYVPIVLTAIWYYWKAVYLSLFLGGLHVSIGVYGTGTIIPGTLIRAVSLLAVALIVAYLSEASSRHYEGIRKSSEEELCEARKQAELYADLMGHDINNLNQVGIGYLEIALDTLKCDDEGRYLLQRPLESMQHSSKLIDNVRKLQRLHTEGLRPEQIDIGKLLSEVKIEYSVVSGRDVTIEYMPAPGCYVLASEQIKEAFSNLVCNAIEHSTGPVIVHMSLEGKVEGGKPYYLIGVEDNGPGIPDLLKSKLFNRSVRGRARTGGSGLGLFLVRSLIEDAEGSIWVEDRVTGDYTKGSRFVVILPACVNREC